ncbi:hypothetical protein LCGC14_2145880, partial [marine sediment metagenome]
DIIATLAQFNATPITTTGVLGAGVTTLAGNNANAAFTLLNLNNTDTPTSGETGQTSDLVFNLTYFNDPVSGVLEAAKISAYKVNDWVQVAGFADTDSGLKFYTTNANTPALALTIDNLGLATFAGNVTTTGNYTGTVLFLHETTTPTPVADDGALYTKNTNELFFQDGAGTEHLLHGDAFSNIWFHGSTVGSMTVEVAISTEDALTKIDSFTVVGNEDDLSHVVGSSATNNLTLSSIAGGEYEISFHASITATGGADKEMVVALGITYATAKDITNVTDDIVTPIVITSIAHGLENGEMVEIVGVLVNTAANGSFIVDGKTDDTFKIVTLDGTATTGNGDYDEGSPTGDVTMEYPGNMVVHREVRGSTLGAISATGLHVLAGSDVLALYVANLDGTTNLTVAAVSLDCFRIGD